MIINETLCGAIASLCCCAITTALVRQDGETTDTHTQTAAAAEGRHVASRRDFKIHMARLHGPGRGSTWKSVQVSVEGVFQFCFLLLVNRNPNYL